MAKKPMVTRDAETGRLVLGREAFAKITAVEGIRMSRSMRGEFEKLDATRASPAKRRATLSAKYGAKKK